MAVILVASLLGPLIERARRRRLKERGEAPPPGPEPEEPKLPYEDLVDQVFGPYMERRRQVYEARRAAAAEAQAEGEVAEEVEEEVEPEPEAAPAPPPPPRPVVSALEEARAVPLPVVGPPPRGPSIDERLFRNPRLSPGAKLVLAAEILGRPRALRRR
jgi:hypothetical protein